MRKFLFILILLTNLSLEASGPVAHVYLAKRFFRHFPSRFSETEQTDFLIGTLFPDIRYTSKLDRHETHYEKMTLEEVLTADSPFVAGVKFHSYVDLVRDQYIRKHRPAVHKAELETDHFSTYIKLLEDEVLFYAGNWSECADSLKYIHPEESKWEIDQSALKKWHSLLSLCLQHPPSKVLLLLSISNSSFFGASPELITEWRRLIPPTAKTEEMKYHVESMIDHFEKEMGKLSGDAV